MVGGSHYPGSMSAADEREQIVHDLAGWLTVALANCRPLGDEIALLRGAGPALVILSDIREAVTRAVELFPELRRVL